MENFLFEELPFTSLELLGLTKEKILGLDKDNLMRLLSGKRTDILRFDFYFSGKRVIADGKLLLERNNDNVTASVIPVRKQIENQYNLTNDELIKLYCGKLINKNIDGQRHLLQLDRETNEVIRAKTAHIAVPFQIDAKERERLLKGKSIRIDTDSGNTKVRIDLLNGKGFALNGETQKIRYVGTNFTETDIKTLNLDQFNLKQDEIYRLMDGYKIIVELPDGTKSKIGLERNEDNTVSVQLFPVKNEINNDLHLQQEQLDLLKKGQTVLTLTDNVWFICQLDKETNEILRRELNSVNTHVIRGIELKPEEKDNLVNGMSISLVNQLTGETVNAKLDLNHKQGIIIEDDSIKLKELYQAGEKANIVLESNFRNIIERDKFVDRNCLDIKDLSNSARAAFDEKQKFYFDYHNPGIVGFIRTDENRSEYMAFVQNPANFSIKM